MNTPTKLETTQTYATAYATLSAIAERLKTSTSAGIDTLAADVAAARQAHAICRARLEAIRAEIDQELAAVRAETEVPGPG